MNAAGSICLALFLTVFGVVFFWYVWVRTFEWELAIWYRKIVTQRMGNAVEAAEDVEMTGSAAGESKAPSNKSGGGEGGEGGSKSPSKHGSKKSGEGGGSKAASKKSGSKNG